MQPVTFDQAHALVLSHANSGIMSFETVELKDAAGRTLADDVFSDLDCPGADISAMDGYCLQAELIAGADNDSTVTLPITAGIDAGHHIDQISPNSCAYIATGGMLPKGADCVVPLEELVVSSDGASVTFKTAVKSGNYVRPRASELKCGDKMVAANTLITASVIGQLANAGQAVIKVIKKPTVAILTSGDEVRMLWEKPLPWQVRNSNCAMLRAQVQEAGATVLEIGIARDIGDHANELFLKAAEAADIIVTSGGISMGRKDPFKQVFARHQINPIFYGIKMKPGKPVFFGLYKNKPVFGLPGNQTSTAVTFELLVRPFIRKLLGLTPDRLQLDLELTCASKNGTNRDFFKRGKIIEQNGKLLVEPLESQESHMLSSLAGAEVLFRHPASPAHLPAADKVRCWLLKG